MNSFVEYIQWLMRWVEAPKHYGPFHLGFLLGMIALCALSIIFLRKVKKDFVFRLILLGIWIVLVSGEVFKQLGYAFSTYPYAFSWYAFPFQLCSMPYYLLPFMFLLKPCKVRSFVGSSCMSFIILGGLFIMFYPCTLTSCWYINIHSMMHHSLQTVAGVVIYVWMSEEASFKNYLKAIPMILGGMLLALVLNVTITKTTGCNPSLWNLNPIGDADAEIITKMRDTLTYPVFFIVYFVALTIASCGIYMAPLGIKKLIAIIKNKKNRA